MTRIPVTRTRDVAALQTQANHQFASATSVEVHYESEHGAVISLEMEIYGSAVSWVVPLTPPAAKQLARELNLAVRDYLNSVAPETESR